MLNVSNEARSLINSGARQYFKATLIFADQTVKSLTESDFMSGSVTYSGGSSQQGSFDVGGCVIKRLKFTLNNFDNRLGITASQWRGMKIIPYFGVKLNNNTMEWVTPDVLYMVSHKRNGNVIVCEAYDGLKFLDEGTITIQAGQTAYNVISTMLTAHGLTLASATFTGYDTQLIAAKEMTERQALAYILQRIGCYAFMRNGQLVIQRYPTSGTVRKTTIFSEEVDTQNMGFTGIRYTCEDGTIYTYGTVTGNTAYVYELKDGDNPLIDKTCAQNAIRQIWYFISAANSNKPRTIEILSDFTIEPGDYMLVKNCSLSSAGEDLLETMTVTNFEYTFGMRERISFDAEEKDVSDLRQVNTSHAVYEAEKDVDDKFSAFDAAYNQFKTLIAQSMGLFFTEEQAQGGGTILYMHDNQSLANSSTVWRLSGNSFTVKGPNDADFVAGISNTGDIIAQRLYAKLVSGDVIQGGILTDQTGLNYWNLNNGELQIQTKNGTYIARMNSGYINYFNNTSSVGKIGTNYGDKMYIRDSSGTATRVSTTATMLDMCLDNGTGISWAHKNGNAYDMKLYYMQSSGNYWDADTLNVGCDLDMHYFDIKRASIKGGILGGTINVAGNASQFSGLKFGINSRLELDSLAKADFYCDLDMHGAEIKNYILGSGGEGISGTYNMVQVKSVNSSGIVTDWTNGCKLVFKNGLLIDSTWGM